MVIRDIPAELRRARNQAIVMLLVSAIGMLALTSTLAFVALSINTTVWIVRFWYFTGQLHEHTLLLDERRR